MRRLLSAVLLLAALPGLTACGDDGTPDPNADDDADGFTVGDGDCDDGDATVNPGATDDWYDGVDSNCDGMSDYDKDGDGADSATYDGDDCDDENATIYPGADEVWDDGIDQDCDGRPDVEGALCSADFTLTLPDGSTQTLDGCTAWDLDVAFEYDPDDAPEVRTLSLSFSATTETDFECSITIAQEDICGPAYYAQGEQTVLATVDCSGIEDAYEGTFPASSGYVRFDVLDGGTAPGSFAGEPLATSIAGRLHVQAGGIDVAGDFAVSLERIAGDGEEVQACAGSDGDEDDDGQLWTGYDGDDCDDTDPYSGLGFAEIVGDEIDEDCDGGEVCYLDADDDGYAEAGGDTIESTDVACTASGEAVAADPGGDCNDGDPLIFPDNNREVPENTVDDDCDGVVDEACQPGSTATDRDGDGASDYIYTWTYDEYGNVLIDGDDYDGDGVVDVSHTYTYTYDADGNMLSQVDNYYDDDGDGVADATYTYTYTYDADGNLLSQVYAYDSGGDGVVDATQSETYTYDADGNVLSEVGGEDRDGDGVVDVSHTYTYTYDADGNVLSESRDLDLDGVAEYTYAYTYDADNNRLTYEGDSDGDGVVDYTYTWTYDGDGNMLSQAYDDDGDGVADETYAWTYDADGNMLSSVFDRGGGDVHTTTWTYDGDGNVLSAVTDHYSDGIADDIVTYTYDAYGNVLTSTHDYDGDGVAVWTGTWAYTYDSDGNILSRVAYDDGVLSGCDYYTYDEYGFLMTSESDNDCDGTAEYSSTYTYEC